MQLNRDGYDGDGDGDGDVDSDDDTMFCFRSFPHIASFLSRGNGIRHISASIAGFPKRGG